MGFGPKVSVVMIFLDAQKYIKQAIESVLAQTYDDWELLLVDDGSTDEGTAIARTFSRDHAGRIRYLDHPLHRNLGTGASRNLGIGHARGEYIAFLDADDKWLPHKLETQVPLLAGRPGVAMVYDAVMLWYPPLDVTGQERFGPPRRIGVEPDTLVEPPMLVPLLLRDIALSPGTCSVLIRREAIHHVGGFEADFRGLYEDQVLFYKLCLEYPVYVAAGSSALYRQHPDSICHRAAAAGTYGSYKRTCLEWLDRYHRERGIADQSVRDALDEALWPYRHPLAYAMTTGFVRFVERMARAAGRRLLPSPLRKSLRRMLGGWPP